MQFQQNQAVVNSTMFSGEVTGPAQYPVPDQARKYLDRSLTQDEDAEFDISQVKGVFTEALIKDYSSPKTRFFPSSTKMALLLLVYSGAEIWVIYLLN